MISIALRSDEVWVSPFKEGEAGGRTPLTLPPPSWGEQEQSRVTVVEEGKGSLEGSDPRLSSSEVTGVQKEVKRRERILKGPLSAVAHSTGC